ncbi:MAG: pantoate--beta-alanine ligase [Candidatus Nitrohelix vancouverensis]|uniref:Pantothenate synthetase n=1 Tax=Candidatus Nitrohelix vancouverensis TaxID=2705534 RepID=A0A7T0C3B5_9BACT|nr:MAG: pantoate--beta-alanine ligase [Candidatus Nitrohelix vancouverensis]
MQIVKTVGEMKSIARAIRSNGENIGFTPTMGCLHAGHMSLVAKSKSECDRSVASIFINPAQFGPTEDLAVYPQSIDQDIALLSEAGVDYLFYPDAAEIYPDGFKTHVEVEGITQFLCGASRPGFFRGVATVVLKLFNIVAPHKAYFGEKDWQQLRVIETLVRDLNLDVEICAAPLIRDEDGLAMSSRNRYLTTRQRQSALKINRALSLARDKIQSGEHRSESIRQLLREFIAEEPETEIDYISICDANNLSEKEIIDGKALIALAVKVGSARLIDNCIVENA